MCVPLRKVDDKEAGPSDYRLIALLNLLGKVYESVIEVRIGRYLEQLRNVPSEELAREGVEDISNMQYGFRHDCEGRSTCDAKFNLTQTIRANARRKRKTYACFLDIKKAYPRTNHAILLKKCWDQGLRGPIYATIDSHLTDRKHVVQLGDGAELQEEQFYPVERGLAEGSLISPVLFTIYINSIVSKIRAAGRGVVLRNKAGKEYELGCLLYADDLVIIAESVEDLNAMLQAAYEWACEHQTEFNLDKGKTEYMVFGGDGLTGEEIWLGDQAVREVLEYRYLGLMLHQKLGWCGNSSIDHLEQKQQHNEDKKEDPTAQPPTRTVSGGQNNKGWSFMTQIKKWAIKMYNKRGVASCMGATPTEFSTATSKNIYRTFVEPVASYDTPVWSQDATNDEELEQEQATCAKHILGVPHSAKVNPAAVRSELGLMSLKRRREIADLIYLGRIQRLVNTDWNENSSNGYKEKMLVR